MFFRLRVDAARQTVPINSDVTTGESVPPESQLQPRHISQTLRVLAAGLDFVEMVAQAPQGFLAVSWAISRSSSVSAK